MEKLKDTKNQLTKIVFNNIIKMSLKRRDKFMKTDDKLSIRIIRKIAFVSIIFICIFAIGVIAAKSDVNSIKIVFADDCEITVMTSKIVVSEILEENHIILEADEKVYPDLNSNIDLTKTITISRGEPEKKVIAEEVESVTTEEILGNYVTITEKIVTEQIEIPFETITKDVSSSGTETTNRVLQEGENGLKEVKYKVRIQDNIELQRDVISETIIKEPVDRIVQISTKVVARSAGSRYSSATLAASVEGKTPSVVTLNTSAYCAASCGGNTRTACGATASSWYTVAAGRAYPAGTIIYIPYFANKPNGGWFVVQDTGGAITNNHLDIWMDSMGECLSFGRRNLECYIYQ